MKNISYIKTITSFLLLAALVLSSGCALTRGVMDIKGKPVANPESGKTVKIVSVTDNRVFEVAPSNASIPSLQGGEINDKSITRRAIARKRNTFGAALGDIVLPENRTVSMVAQERITRVFRESGYRVLEEGDSGYERAIPVRVSIEKFWAWLSPGWKVALEFKADMRIQGLIGNLGKGKNVKGYVRLKSNTGSGGAFRKTIIKGLDDFASNLKKEI